MGEESLQHHYVHISSAFCPSLKEKKTQKRAAIKKAQQQIQFPRI